MVQVAAKYVRTLAPQVNKICTSGIIYNAVKLAIGSYIAISYTSN